MNKGIVYGLIGVGAIGGLFILNSSMVNVGNELTSKVDPSNTLSILREVKTNNNSLTFAVESNNGLVNSKSWDDGIRLEVDYFKKEFLRYRHVYGDAVDIKLREDGISVNSFKETKGEGKEYLYGYIGDENIKNIILEGNGKKEEAEIIPYGESRFWLIENTLGENPKVIVEK